MTTTIQHAPGELYDEDCCVMALRIDGPSDTAGKARAYFARETSEPFTSVRLRKAAYRYYQEYADDAKADGISEPYDGWPWIECGPGEDGALYWQLVNAR